MKSLVVTVAVLVTVISPAFAKDSKTIGAYAALSSAQISYYGSEIIHFVWKGAGTCRACWDDNRDK